MTVIPVRGGGSRSCIGGVDWITGAVFAFDERLFFLGGGGLIGILYINNTFKIIQNNHFN